MNPAAVLSIMVTTEGVRAAQGDLSRLDSSVHKSSGKMSGMLAAGAKAGALGIAGIAAGAAAAAPKLISLASDAQETASKFKIVFRKETEEATKALDDFSKATGTSKFALRDQAAGLQALIRPMGLNTKKAADMSVGLTKLATDLASFNNTSVQDAIVALQSGLVGEAEPLRRYGVQLSAARVEAFAYAEGIAKQGKELTAAQKAQASYAIILKDTTLAQGDATRTADSFANQWKRLKSQVTDLATELGVKLIPAATSVVNSITGFITKLQSGGDEMNKFRDTAVTVWGAIKTGVGAAVQWLSGVLNEHRDDVENVAQAARNVWTAIKFAWVESILPTLKRVLPAIQQMVKGVFNVIGGIIKTISSLLTGDFGAAWDGVKQIFKGGLQAILGNFRLYTAPIREMASKIGEGIVKALDKAWEAVKKGVSALAAPFVAAFDRMSDSVEKLLGFAGDVVGAIKDVVGWIGKIKVPSINLPFGIGGGGDGMGVPAIGRFGGGLKGARPSMAPFAAAGARFGLRVSDGRRPPGTRTSSGGISYHSTGEALDLAGSPAGMLAYFRYLKNTSGGRLAELIYTPGGIGIKNGQAFRYTGKVAADHFDHVHVAFDTGVPGVGDGIGQIASLWTSAGGSAAMANMAAAIAMAESGGRPSASHRNADGSIDRGLWQINSVHGALSTFDRMGNARAAIRISGNGRNWNPWTVYRTGAYKKFLTAAKKVTKKAKGGRSGGGITGYDPAAMYGAPERTSADIRAGRNTGAVFLPGTGIKGTLDELRPPQVVSETGTDDSNQALIDAINELAALEKQRIDLTNTQLQQARASLNVSQSQYQILANAIADVANGQIGQRLGLGLSGLRAAPGSVARL